MTHHDEAVVTDRLRRALLAVQSAQIFLLNTYRRLKTLPQTEVEAAFNAFSTVGLVVDGKDRCLVAEAQRYLAEGAA